MKKFLKVVLFVFIFALTVTTTFAKPASKVNICHREDERGVYHLINVSENAQPAHMTHGDGIPGGNVPGMDYKKFANDCTIPNLATFIGTDSLYYNCPDVCSSVYGSGAISFTWDPVTGNVTGGYYNEIVPPTTGTTYYNVITGGSVIGNIVNLTFNRTLPNIYGPFYFTGTLVGNVLTGTLDGPYYFTATGN